MNEEPNAPMPNETAGVFGWLDIWIRAVTKPNEQTYVSIASSPNAKTSTALIWMFISSLISFFFGSLVQGATIGRLMEQFGTQAAPRSSFGVNFVSALCGAPVAAVIFVVTFVISVGIIQWVAKMFGGTGTFEQLVYTLAAIAVPVTLASSIVSLFSVIPYVGVCFGVLSFLLSLYLLVLEIIAIKAVNGFGYGQAIASFFLPVLVIACCAAVVVGGLMSFLAPAISQTFESINSELIP